MPSDFIGIKNQNEFFLNNYMQDVVADFKETLDSWNKLEEESKQPSPVKLLHIFGNKFKAINRAKAKKLSGNFTDEDFKIPFDDLFNALGYERIHEGRVLPHGQILYVDGEVCRTSGRPDVWLIIMDGHSEEDACQSGSAAVSFLEKNSNVNGFSAALGPYSEENCKVNGSSVAPADEEYDPFKYLTLYNVDKVTGEVDPASAKQVLLEEVVNGQIFFSQDLPRYLLLISESELRLLERFKWQARRSLIFDFKEIFEANSDISLKAMAVFTHRESLAPNDGFALLDTFDENSHKKAYSVSSDLKYALREGIELLGNEVIRSRREDLGDFSAIDAGALSLQCLRFMYRLLFLFYIEARPELNYVPNKSEIYELGYSLETLRDSELMELGDDESRDGTYIQQSLKILFSLIWNGHNVATDSAEKIAEQGFHANDFSIAPIKSHLFDPKRTPLLNDVKLRDVVLQRVIRLMSLTLPGHNRGRISYAHLGINQLGAVYESLLSYKGFIAHEDLYEVKRRDDNYDELNTAYFVTKNDLERFTDEEKVYEKVEGMVDGETTRLKHYPKGTFIYRMAGRSRETSASYYTPECLTKCLVKYSLEELLADKSADDILHLTVCEPAMGSAAFLNEAVNQMAQSYLEKKQKELEKQIPLDDYATELQRVKMYLADNNVFGVDLNPVAVELAEVSLWLNTISYDGVVPWFGNRLCCGNSLVGARRQVWKPDDLSKVVTSAKREKKIANWWENVPKRVWPGSKRNAEDIYHFLLPDKAVLDYGDKVIKGMAETQFGQINKWKKDFFTVLSEDEIKELQDLSAAVDNLWQSHIQQQANLRQKTSNAFMVWGQSLSEDVENKTVQDKDRILQLEKYAKGVKESSSYLRLKLAMDYWCAFWFWPLDKVDWLPTRDEYFVELSLILRGQIFNKIDVQEKFQEIGFQTEQDFYFQTKLGIMDLETLYLKFERLKIVRELACKYHFHHWELEFADIFQERGGFDLILGNPPWIKIGWEEGSFLGDYDPEIIFRKNSAADLVSKRFEILNKYNLKDEYIDEYCSITGLQNFCGALQNYPLLSGVRTNLYKCFLPQAWMIANDSYVAGFIHPEGIYSDLNGGKLRREIYQRLRYHFQFRNELNLFADVNSRIDFSLNIYSVYKSNISFINIWNIFHTKTIDACFKINNKNVTGIKDENGSWNLEGHQDRIIHIDEKILSTFGKIWGSKESSPLEARLINLHAIELIDVLKCFENNKTIASIGNNYFSSVMWNETIAQKNKIIQRIENYFPKKNLEAIISGPHFFIGNPLYKTPKRKCKNNTSYDVIDLSNIYDDYLPRVNYIPYNKNIKEYKSKIHKIKLDDVYPYTDYYKLCFRLMINTANERTLIASIIQKEISHIFTVISYVFKNSTDLLAAASGAFSLPYDFYVKSTGRGHMSGLFDTMPLLNKSIPMFTRVLALSCLTVGYKDLWEEAFDPNMRFQKWTKDDPRLDNNFFASLTAHWQRNCALRTDYARRQALVELDVLVSRALGMTLDQLQTIYRIQFPVMRRYENDTWYDKNGRIVFTISKGLIGVGLPRNAIKNDTSFSIETTDRKEKNIALGFEDIEDLKSGIIKQIINDDTLPNGPIEREIIYEAPFSVCKREDDYEQAWKWFDEHRY